MSESKLNSKQLEAINHATGPLLVIAGAGTGKTTVITQRVSKLITDKSATAEEILCLTFTEKASREMETRIDQALPYGYGQLWITTFHSFCDRILKDEALNIGLDPGYRLLSDTDSITLVQKNFFEFNLEYYRPLGNPQKFINGMLQHISRLNDEDITWEEYQNWANNVSDNLEKNRYIELANFYRDYQQLKISKSLFDFSDLISYTLKLFRDRPNILKKYQEKFKYILVDEFQDTNYAQNQLVNLLAGQTQNLTVVADDDQAIYRWRGAAISNVVQFRNIYPNTKVVVLNQNYRSTQEILDRSYDLIQHNNPDRLEITEKIDKHLLSNKKNQGERIEFLHFTKIDNEADGVVKKIQSLKEKNPETQYKDIAILVRANAHADPFIRSLARADIPHQFLGPTKLFHQPEIKDLIAYLTMVENFSDNSAVFRVLSSPFFNISVRDLASVCNYSKKANIDIFEACEICIGINPPPPSAATIPQLRPDTKDTLKQIVDITHHHLGQKNTDSAAQILFDFLQKTGMFQSIVDYREPFTQDKSQNVIKFFDKIKSYETIHANAYIPEINQWLHLASEIGESPLTGETDWQAEDAVNILTIHSSKGLEFPVVFLVNLVSQRFPSTARKEQIPIPDELIKEIPSSGDFHLQEERRLMYVGITRAKNKLFLTASDFYGDGKRAKKLSPFILETIGESAIEESKVVQTSQLSLLDYQTPKNFSSKVSQEKIKIDYLSYSQIQTFLDCPLHYKLKYILKLPTPPSAASSFGTTIHATLKEFYSQNGQKNILDIYKKFWTQDGYNNKSHAEKYFAKGEKYLTQFVQNEYNPQTNTIMLEEPFTTPLIPQDRSRILKIGGKIDRIDLLADGTLEIIDYKTSEKSMEQKAADNSLQLSFYALAASILKTPPFGIDINKIKLSLYYFEEQKKVSTTRSIDQLEEAKQQIFSYADAIVESDFKCSGSLLCKMCDYKLLCDVEAKDEN